MTQETGWTPKADQKPKATGRLNYWGYTTGYYYAPKASYSSGQKKRPVQEMKTLVKERSFVPKTGRFMTCHAPYMTAVNDALMHGYP